MFLFIILLLFDFFLSLHTFLNFIFLSQNTKYFIFENLFSLLSLFFHLFILVFIWADYSPGCHFFCLLIYECVLKHLLELLSAWVGVIKCSVQWGKSHLAVSLRNNPCHHFQNFSHELVIFSREDSWFLLYVDSKRAEILVVELWNEAESFNRH